MQFVQRCDAFVILVVDVCSRAEELTYNFFMACTSYSIIRKSILRRRRPA